MYKNYNILRTTVDNHIVTDDTRVRTIMYGSFDDAINALKMDVKELIMISLFIESADTDTLINNYTNYMEQNKSNVAYDSDIIWRMLMEQAPNRTELDQKATEMIQDAEDNTGVIQFTDPIYSDISIAFDRIEGTAYYDLDGLGAQWKITG